jgi:hypothetical protein
VCSVVNPISYISSTYHLHIYICTNYIYIYIYIYAPTKNSTQIMRDLRKYDLETQGLLEIDSLRVRESDFTKAIIRQRFKDYDYTDSGYVEAEDLGKVAPGPRVKRKRKRRRGGRMDGWVVVRTIAVCLEWI